jgi:hypothetical protein
VASWMTANQSGLGFVGDNSAVVYSCSSRAQQPFCKEDKDGCSAGDWLPTRHYGQLFTAMSWEQ